MPKTDKRNRIKATLMAAAIAALPFGAHAAGLGKITVLSALGQPLKAELEVTATRDEAPSLMAKVAAAEAFRQAGIEYVPALSTLRFSREIKERAGRHYIELTTDRPLNEPFIDMLVELSWASGRLVREYTFLLDPPDLMPPAAAAPVLIPEIRTDSAKSQEMPAPGRREASVGDSRPAVVKAPPPKPTMANAKDATRRVVSGDTLGKIAAETKPAGVSLDQMLVALFRGNQDAFDGENMNRLRAGKILSIPDADSVGRIPAGEARKEVVAQAMDFNAYRKKLAAAAAAEPARQPVASNTASGRITPRVEEKAPPPAAGKDKLEVSRTEIAKTAGNKQLQGRVATLEEDIVARDRALKEASSRIAELEKNLNDLKKLAELKSQAGADMQKQAQAAKPEATKTAPAPAVPPAAAGKSAEPPKADETKPVDTASQTDAAKPVEAEAPVAPPKPPAKKKKPTPPPPPPPEPDFLEENAPLVFGGGGVVALLLGWLGFTAWRRKRKTVAENVPQIAESDLSAHSVFSASVAPPPSEQEPSQFSTTAVNMGTPQDAVDPVVEADTFLAFGRDAQAEEILLEAMKTDPQRLAVPLKLLEIYAARKNADQFAAVAKVLHDQTGGQGADWEKAAAMGAMLDPGNRLYGAEPAVSGGMDMGATMVLNASPLATSAEPDVQVAVEPAVQEPEPEPESADTAVLDFDLDLGAPDASADTAEAAPSVPEVASDVAALDFDLDLGSPEPAAPVAEALAAPAEPEVSALDIEFDIPAPAASEVPAPALEMPAVSEPAALAAEPATDSGSIDFEFDLGTPEPVPAPELPDAPVIPELASPASAIDLGSISLDLDVPLAEAAAEEIPALEMPAVDTPPDNPEVATKLELAMAYEEMGDRDGARELYQEALAEGSPAQQDIARTKLAGLGG